MKCSTCHLTQRTILPTLEPMTSPSILLSYVNSGFITLYDKQFDNDALIPANKEACVSFYLSRKLHYISKPEKKFFCAYLYAHKTIEPFCFIRI